MIPTLHNGLGHIGFKSIKHMEYQLDGPLRVGAGKSEGQRVQSPKCKFVKKLYLIFPSIAFFLLVDLVGCCLFASLYYVVLVIGSISLLCYYWGLGCHFHLNNNMNRIRY